MWTCSRIVPHLSVICVSTQLQTAAPLALPNHWGLHMKQMDHSLTHSGCYQLMHLDTHMHTHACTYPRTYRNTDQSPPLHSSPIWYQSCRLFPTASESSSSPRASYWCRCHMGLPFISYHVVAVWQSPIYPSGSRRRFIIVCRRGRYT